MPWRYYWHFVLPRSIRSLARFFPITSRSPATTRSYVRYSESTQRVSERAVTLPVPVLPIARLLIRRGIPPGRQVYIRSSRWLHGRHANTHTHTMSHRHNDAMKLRSEAVLACFVRKTGCTLRYLSSSLPPGPAFSKACTFVIRLCYPALLSRGILMLIYDEDLQICRTAGAFPCTRVRPYRTVCAALRTRDG